MAIWPYKTERWQRLRRAKLAKDPLCQYCPPGQKRLAREVDHARSIAAGGGVWDWNNLRSACTPCHSRKSRYVEQLGRAVPPRAGVDARTGRPIGDHWWNKWIFPAVPHGNHGTTPIGLQANGNFRFVVKPGDLYEIS